MKFTLSFWVICFYVLSASGQNNDESFLMYETSLRDSTRKGWRSEPFLFRLRGTATIHKSKLTFRSVGIQNDNAKQSYPCVRKGDQVTFTENGKASIGQIYRDSVFHWDGKTQTIFLPINPIGLQVEPFEGKLRLEESLDIFVSKPMVRKGQQDSQEILLINSYGVPTIEPGAFRPYDSKYFNVVDFERTFFAFQLEQLISDSVWKIHPTNHLLFDGNKVSSHLVLKKDFPTKSELDRIDADLQGKWRQLGGWRTSGTPDTAARRAHLSLDSLRDCAYSFNFQKGKVVVQRSFSDKKFTNIVDSLTYQIHPSGEIILLKGENRTLIFVKKLDRHNALLGLCWDWWRTEDTGQPHDVLLRLVKE